MYSMNHVFHEAYWSKDLGSEWHNLIMQMTVLTTVPVTVSSRCMLAVNREWVTNIEQEFKNGWQLVLLNSGVIPSTCGTAIQTIAGLYVTSNVTVLMRCTLSTSINNGANLQGGAEVEEKLFTQCDYTCSRQLSASQWVQQKKKKILGEMHSFWTAGSPRIERIVYLIYLQSTGLCGCV